MVTVCWARGTFGAGSHLKSQKLNCGLRTARLWYEPPQRSHRFNGYRWVAARHVSKTCWRPVNCTPVVFYHQINKIATREVHSFCAGSIASFLSKVDTITSIVQPKNIIVLVCSPLSAYIYEEYEFWLSVFTVYYIISAL